MAVKANVKIRLKRETVLAIAATIPSSEDHTDGTWLDTDIYIGELSMNTGQVGEASSVESLWLRTAEGIRNIPLVTAPGTEGQILVKGAKGTSTYQDLTTINGYAKASLDIGDWDMDASNNATVAHGLSVTEWKTVRGISAIVRNDADNEYYPLNSVVASDGGAITGGVNQFDATYIYLDRPDGYRFDGVNYDSTSYNRGWITFEYIPD